MTPNSTQSRKRHPFSSEPPSPALQYTSVSITEQPSTHYKTTSTTTNTPDTHHIHSNNSGSSPGQRTLYGAHLTETSLETNPPIPSPQKQQHRPHHANTPELPRHGSCHNPLYNSSNPR